MLIDIQRFVTQEKPYWEELESILDRLHKESGRRMGLDEAERFHYLYERVSSDLSRLRTFSSEREVRRHLEALTARAYCEVHNARPSSFAFRPGHWLTRTFPAAFRRHGGAFRLSCAAMLAGVAVGAMTLALDPSTRKELMPFSQLLEDPAERVRQEEQAGDDHLRGQKTAGAAFYMTHNTQVSLVTAAMGITWGIGTLLLLFSNGILVGVVAADYVMAGKTQFLVAWLLPHGSVEIPAILIAGQAGLVLAGALLGRRTRIPLRRRLRNVRDDLLTILLGVALMLVWAGFVEAFLSQYHQPVIPYWFKITLGTAELALLWYYLAWAGRVPANAVTADREGDTGLTQATSAILPGSDRP